MIYVIKIRFKDNSTHIFTVGAKNPYEALEKEREENCFNSEAIEEIAIIKTKPLRQY